MMERSFFLLVIVLLQVFNASLCVHGREHESLSFIRYKKHEQEALLKFKHSFTQDPMNLLSSWVGEDCCQWHGVTCDSVTHHVVKLNLRTQPSINFDIGLVPDQFPMVSSGLSSALLKLKFLTHLDLSRNEFFGSPIPEFIGSMTELRYLALSFAGFSGSFPPQLGNLTNLVHLDLSYNSMKGSLPSSFGKLTNLSYLDLSYNEFTGRVPTSFVKFSAFKYLDLSYNQLGGLIPDFIGNLTQIEHLDISSNSLQGTVLGIGNLSKLSYLDMSYNNLNLDLDSSFNWQPRFQLGVFNVHSCGINTVFPHWLGNQTQIEHLDLSYTGILGELPGWLWNSSNLKYILLSGNRLTGSLPQDTPDRPCIYELQWLDLHNNLLTGTIPKWLGYLVNIQVIDLSSNLLTGPIFIEENSFFPIVVRTVPIIAGSFLWVLDLSDNMLSGNIQFGNVNQYASLQILSLQGNHFNGTIPSQLCDFGSLMVLQLAHNRLIGHIPSCLGSISFTKPYNSAASKNLQIEEIIKGIVEESTGTSAGQSIVDLSHNYLDGTIPEELANNSALFALNLSYNHLTGHIPKNIGSLKSIESLDLSNNRLSGTIPQSLSSISWLSKLNLSNNHLHGPIPTGRQLQTLDDPSIYASNSGLCGFPLPGCTKPEPPPPSLTNVNPTSGKDDVEKKDKYYELWFILAVMSGVATGFWGVVGTLVIKRSWRHAYFRYVEYLGDRIYVPVKVRVNRFKRRFNENL